MSKIQTLADARGNKSRPRSFLGIEGFASTKSKKKEGDHRLNHAKEEKHSFSIGFCMISKIQTLSDARGDKIRPRSLFGTERLASRKRRERQTREPPKPTQWGKRFISYWFSYDFEDPDLFRYKKPQEMSEVRVQNRASHFDKKQRKTKETLVETSPARSNTHLLLVFVLFGRSTPRPMPEAARPVGGPSSERSVSLR